MAAYAVKQEATLHTSILNILKSEKEISDIDLEKQLKRKYQHKTQASQRLDIIGWNLINDTFFSYPKIIHIFSGNLSDSNKIFKELLIVLCKSGQIFSKFSEITLILRKK